MINKNLLGEEIIKFKNKKWKVINQSEVSRLDETKDIFIVALSGNQVLSYLESNMIETYHIDNYKTFHTKFWNSWLRKKHSYR